MTVLTNKLRWARRIRPLSSGCRLAIAPSRLAPSSAFGTQRLPGLLRLLVSLRPLRGGKRSSRGIYQGRCIDRLRSQLKNGHNQVEAGTPGIAYEGTFRVGYAKRGAMPCPHETSKYEPSGNLAQQFKRKLRFRFCQCPLETVYTLLNCL